MGAQEDLARLLNGAEATIHARQVETLREVRKQQRDLQRAIDRRRKADLPVTSTWLEASDEYRATIRTLREEIQRSVRETAAMVERLAPRAAALGNIYAGEQLDTVLPPLSPLGIKQAADVGPFARKLREHGAEAVAKAAEAVRKAALEEKRKEVSAAAAAKLIEAVGGHETMRYGFEARAILAARTSLMDADRAAVLASWQEVDEVTGWTWRSRLAATTCAMCWAMHGTIHPLTEAMDTHPRCECLPTPIRPGSRPLVPGTDQFERLSGTTKSRILGPGKFALYERGLLQVTPDGIVKVGTHADWGRVRSERTLAELTGT